MAFLSEVSVNCIRMKIKFLGAAGTVTGSCYLLTSDDGQSILIDCGLFQGTREIDSLNYGKLECEPSKLLGVVLTHAHLDHCGRLPLLVKMGLTTPVFMTEPTYDLTVLSLYDTAKINKEDKKNNALYTEDDVEKVIKFFKTVEYGEPFEIGPFSINFRDAGHIIGSASVEITDHSAKGVKKIVFSGDLGNSPEPLVRATELIDSADVVVMESTYGDRVHPDEDPRIKIAAEINEVESTGGVLLIPAFSIERSQELLHLIHHLKKDGKVKAETEVVFDAPMGQKATVIFEKYSKYYNNELKGDLETSDPFSFPGLNVIEKHQDSIKVSESSGTKVIIAGSGMMTGGRILGHAETYLPLPSTRLLIVGYQGEGTLGRRILEGSKEVNIKGKPVKINATVSETQSMSSHADQTQLMVWLKNIKNVKKLFLTHGEDGPRGVLKEKISKEVGLSSIELPALNEELDA